MSVLTNQTNINDNEYFFSTGGGGGGGGAGYANQSILSETWNTSISAGTNKLIAFVNPSFIPEGLVSLSFLGQAVVNFATVPANLGNIGIGFGITENLGDSVQTFLGQTVYEIPDVSGNAQVSYTIPLSFTVSFEKPVLLVGLYIANNTNRAITSVDYQQANVVINSINNYTQGSGSIWGSL